MKTHRKMTACLTTLLAALSFVPPAHAFVSEDAIRITGYVRNDSGQPVGGVDVTGDDYVGDTYPAKTDENGFYSIDLKAEGNYRVTVNCDQLAELDYGCVNPGAVTMTSGTSQLDFVVLPEVRPLLITNTFLFDGNVGQAYRIQLTAKGGRPPYRWQLASNSTNLPDGLALNPRGLISGTPVAEALSTITIQVRDANAVVTNRVFSLTINPASPAPAALPPPN